MGGTGPQGFALDPIRDIQVLCPMNRGGVGARSLNIELQAALNPAGDRTVERFGRTFAASTRCSNLACSSAIRAGTSIPNSLRSLTRIIRSAAPSADHDADHHDRLRASRLLL
jgi:hypothetical protein